MSPELAETVSQIFSFIQRRNEEIDRFCAASAFRNELLGVSSWEPCEYGGFQMIWRLQ